LNLHILPTGSEAAIAAARDIRDYINGNPNALICLAAGETPLPVYQALIQMQKNGEADLNGVFYLGLDEWVGLDKKTPGSCAQVMNSHFYGPAGINMERVFEWDGKCACLEAEKRRAEAWIAKLDGIGLALLGVGMNGHVGFNEPNTGLQTGAITVPLDDTTKQVSVKYFGKALPVEYGVSIGAGELKKAKRLLLIATGKNKAEIIKKTVCESATPAAPASLLMDHPDITVYADEDAAALIAAAK